MEFYDRVKELIDGGQYDTKDDFTVVMQPFMAHTDPLTLVVFFLNCNEKQSTFSYSSCLLKKQNKKGCGIINEIYC